MFVRDFIHRAALAFPGKPAFIDGDRTLTWPQVDERSDRFAVALQTLGVTKDDAVGLLSYEYMEVMEHWFACLKIGARRTGINWRYSERELLHIVADSEIKVLLISAECVPLVEKHLDDFRGRGIVLIGYGADHGLEQDYETLLLASTGTPRRPELDDADIAMISYTSGTTGLPKGAMITHGMTFYNCVNMGGPHRISPDTVQLTVLPLFHTGGLNCYTNPVLHAGGAVYIMRAFDPAEGLRLLGDPELGITHFFGVPANYQFMAQQPEFADTDLSRIVTAGVGGAPVPVPLLEIWDRRGLGLAQGFGMTETSPTVLVMDASDAMSAPGSAGKPALHNQVKIVDENENEVAPGEIGELWCKGPNITPGYWNREEATAKAIKDGWLNTGDAARMDENGFYYIVDRTKDMYISGGENVYPAEVENVIYQLDQIAEAAVIGVPDDKWGEIGCAVIVLKPGAELSPEDLIAHCRANLATFKTPKRVEFIQALPRNATGKVLKRTLREQV